MTRWPFYLFLLLSVAAVKTNTSSSLTSSLSGITTNSNNDDDNNGISGGVSYKKTVLTVGYLTSIKGEHKDRQGLAISGALTMALDEINKDKNLLPNVTLQLRWNDTKGDRVLATKIITEMICDGVATFFGPEGGCYVEAIVSQSRNIPMISYVSENFFSLFFYPLLFGFYFIHPESV